jgi:hypothetical protein
MEILVTLFGTPSSSSVYEQEKMSQNYCRRDLYMPIALGEQDAPRRMSYCMPDVTKTFTLIVGEMLDILSYLRVYGARIKCLNQSICPWGMKYLASISHTYDEEAG